MQETITVRTWAPDRRKRTDGSSALRERNLRITSAHILQQEQWPRWRHRRTITYVIRVDLLEFSSAAAARHSQAFPLRFSLGCHPATPFFLLNSPRSVCWYHCHRVRGAVPLSSSEVIRYDPAGLTSPKLEGIIWEREPVLRGSRIVPARPGKAGARHTGELPLIPRLWQRDPYCYWLLESREGCVINTWSWSRGPQVNSVHSTL